MENPIKNDYDALVSALMLALVAPDHLEEEYTKCIEMAEQFASKLTPAQVEKAKKQAQDEAAIWNQSN